MKKGFTLIALLALASSAFAAGEFSQLTDAAGDGKETIQQTIGAWMWVSALIPFGLAFFLFSKVKDYQERQEEQGQYQPKVAKYVSLVGAIIGGFIIMYIIYGLFGAAFFDKSFSEMWEALVMDFFSSII